MYVSVSIIHGWVCRKVNMYLPFNIIVYNNIRSMLPTPKK